jgi:hypothetical protein
LVPARIQQISLSGTNMATIAPSFDCELQEKGNERRHHDATAADADCHFRGATGMSVDSFGNSHAPDLTYARGEILRSTEDDFQKLQRAWSLIRERGPGSIYIFTGLEHGLPLAAGDLQFADDEIAPALSFERLKELALDHLGGSPATDDVAVFNRLTGATMATHLTLVKPNDVVIGARRATAILRSCGPPGMSAHGLSIPPGLVRFEMRSRPSAR